MYRTDMYEGLMAETVVMTSANGDWINAFFARPLGAGPFPEVVLAHHMPGWDEWYREATLKVCAARIYHHHTQPILSRWTWYARRCRGESARGGRNFG